MRDWRCADSQDSQKCFCCCFTDLLILLCNSICCFFTNTILSFYVSLPLPPSIPLFCCSMHLLCVSCLYLFPTFHLAHPFYLVAMFPLQPVNRRLTASPPPLSFLSAAPELTFWFYVKEHLNRHELQRFYSLHQISSELGRGRAWLRCALNEHSLERYLHTLLADRPRLGLVQDVCVCVCVVNVPLSL